MFIVKFLLDDFAFEHFLADLYLQRGVEFCIVALDEGHADALIYAEAMIAGRHFAHLFALHVEDWIAVTGDGFIHEFDADEFLCDAVCLLLCEGFLADELGLVELAEHRQTSHDGGDVCAEFVAIKRQTDLEAQGVATTKAARFAATARYEFVPSLLRELVRAVDFEAVLACVARAGYDNRRIRKCGNKRIRRDGVSFLIFFISYFLIFIELQLAAGDAEHLFDDGFGLWSLDCQLPIEVALMVEADVEACCVLLHPSHVLVDVCRVDDEEEIVLAHLIDEQVIDRTAVGIEHHTIIYLSNGCPGDVVRKDVLNVTLSVGTRDAHLSHVTHIEDAASRAYGIVLVGDVGVLDGHDEAAEG